MLKLLPASVSDYVVSVHHRDICLGTPEGQTCIDSLPREQRIRFRHKRAVILTSKQAPPVDYKNETIKYRRRRDMIIQI